MNKNEMILEVIRLILGMDEEQVNKTLEYVKELRSIWKADEVQFEGEDKIKD